MAHQNPNFLIKFLKENSLSVVIFLLFLFSLIGLIFTGFFEYNSEQVDHGEKTISLAKYIFSSHFIEAVFENWESEFLQMWAFVMLTIFLKQKGSSESKKLHGKEPVDATFRSKYSFIDKLYTNSLGLALLFLFLVSFVLHGMSGHSLHNQELASHGEQPISLISYFISSTFWFESFQNWQSEFLSVGVLIVFTVFLRQQGSPESKPVNAPNSKTGNS